MKDKIFRFIDKLIYRFGMWFFHADETYIRESFSYLAQLDIGDWVRIHDDILFKAWGNEVHVIEDTYQCVIKEGINGCVYVDEWRNETREVILEFGVKHETNWWEVYRSGKWISSTRFISYLKLLYGEGPNHAISKSKSETLHVCDAPTESH